MTEPAGEVVAAARIVLDGDVLEPGWLRIVDGIVVDAGAGTPDPRLPVARRVAGTIVPGFVDMHCHGGGGYGFTDPEVAQVRAALAFHASHGNAATMLSLVTAPADELLAQVRRLAPLVAAGEAPGIHLEGPWLSRARCGAQDPRAMRDPDPAEIDRLLEAGDGAIGLVTLAPERPGALDAIDRFVAAGVVVALGHTDASYDQTAAAVDRGATVATHLFNGMRPFTHRDPGPILALLDDERVVVELIGDGVHVDPRVVSSVAARVGAGRVALISDAMAAAGSADGRYRLGALDVTVADGVARLSDGGAIAGGTSTMAQQFGRILAAPPRGCTTELEALTAAVTMTSTTPARVLDLAETGLGQLSVGAPARFAVV
ncbi:N-acetylglucosamine-6-phosphate deacetylase [Gordonia sp. X0973]|uniref:N-acetylglucosamine-6-phosphate deacetylase n=1 Tax=Gordonia sp. X0973 TaxID=2742602 RepID=UPI000F51B008|nr:N-acetylglucosamine-6-phosphate deacetylase [Gordonia sp. X0973]QKT05798.1 N-acetylglucosamine-6-phosphate deacetylase [Gordonia sp. X0973]